ncbi:MAG: trigger factor [Desulfuromonadales bacterium C00003068]|jgi:trigger factor|nr:MAG: trigger factor [Desulfuromonadales bacterium C00003068]
MNVQVEEISSVKKKICVEVSADRVSDEIAKAYKKIAKTAKIKGFRQGKIPMKVVEQYYAEQMEQEVIGGLINESYYKALMDHKVPAISDPSIENNSGLEKGKPFTFEAHVEVKPEVVAKDYTGFELQKEIIELDDQTVEDRIAEMTGSRDSQEVVDRDDVQNGDFVTIDFEGFVDGVAFAGGAAQDHILELGSGSFIPGFEEQLVGANRGDDKDICVTFPAEYGNEELAGKEATFKVAVKEIKAKVAAVLTDELAKEFGAESVEELRQKVADGYKDQEEKRIEEDLKERLMTALVEGNAVEVPDTMISRQLDFMHRNIGNRLKQQGMTLEMMGMTDESFRSMYRDTAIKQVQGSLVLEAIGQQENISVDDSEIDGRLEEIAKMANAPLDEVKKHYAADEARKNLLAQIEEEKVITFLLGQSKVEEVAKESLIEAPSDEEQE